MSWSLHPCSQAYVHHFTRVLVFTSLCACTFSLWIGVLSPTGLVLIENINISSNNETTSPRSSSSPFISDGNVDNPLQSIDIFLQDYWNENYDYVEESDLHEPQLLKEYMPSIYKSLPDVFFDLPKLSPDQNRFFDELFVAEDIQDVRASTAEQRAIKKLVDTINDSINDQYKDDISEYEHMMRNIVQFIDASIQKVPDYCFESTLQATAIHRNLGGDPTEHARMGYRVDVLIKFTGLGLELRDVWTLAKDQLNGVNTSNLVVWGFTVVARSIRIYALAVAGGLNHLILAYEAPIPSASWNMCNTKIAYCTMIGFLQKLNATKMMLANLNNERTKTLCCGIKRKRKAVSYSFPPIVSTPQSKKRKR
ncbi:hypothetical protein RhiirA5_497342 [Rhizophagus irregularis]|uniref:Uncharacterized protein n=2 Tax=Rhizophagus irregularis TaxID=588596 RepID=A0A2N0PYH3_9GLOM|nr:hypothetical protein RhiirA5_497342 [Rhizophagus irregularis]